MAGFEIPIAAVEHLPLGHRLYLPDEATADVFLVRVPADRSGRPIPGSIEVLPGKYFSGFSTICTHMGCRLLDGNPSSDPPSASTSPLFVCGPCACHGTTFDLLKHGLVILGPATQNLPQLRLRLDVDRGLILADGWLREAPWQDIDPREETWPLPNEA